MRTLYLHIGWRKTGTSAIQTLIADRMNGEGLGGITLIPAGVVAQDTVTGASPIAHHKLAAFHHHRQWVKAWDAVRQFVRTSGKERFLVTTEMFSARLAMNDGFSPALARRLAIFDRVIVPFWLRRQDSFIASLTVQLAKGGAKGRFAGDPLPAFPDANYHRILAGLERHVRGIEYRPHLYHEGTNVVREFLSVLMLDGSTVSDDKPISVNTSVSPEMYLLQCQVSRAAKQRGVPPRPLQLALLRAWELMPAGTRRSSAIPLTHEDRFAAIERYRGSNRRLCRRFGLDRAFFDPPRETVLEAPPYNIPSTVSPEFLNDIRASLRRVAPTIKSEYFSALIEILQSARSDRFAAATAYPMPAA